MLLFALFAPYLLDTASQAVPEGPSGYGWLLARSILALLAVCALAYLVLKVVARRTRMLSGRGVLLLRERLVLDQGRVLYLVQAGRRTLLIGGAEHAPLVLLADVDGLEEGSGRPRSFAEVLTAANGSGEAASGSSKAANGSGEAASGSSKAANGRGEAASGSSKADSSQEGAPQGAQGSRSEEDKDKGKGKGKGDGAGQVAGEGKGDGEGQVEGKGKVEEGARGRRMRPTEGAASQSKEREP